MGKRKKRQGTSPGSLPSSKSAKQPKIEEHFAGKRLAGKSIPPFVSNSLERLEWDRQGDVTERQMLDFPDLGGGEHNDSRLFSQMSPATACRETEIKPTKFNNKLIQSVESLPWENTTEFMAKQCLLTAQTVISIFEQLIAIQHNVETLKKDIAVFLQEQHRATDTSTKAPTSDPSKAHTHGKEEEKEQRSREIVKEPAKKGQPTQKNSLSPRKTARGGDINRGTNREVSLEDSKVSSLKFQQSHRSLQTQQVVLRIHMNRINHGRWITKSAIVNSLSQLLHSHWGQIDLCVAEWLPEAPNWKRILLFFKQPTIPLMLFKMKAHLASFQIFPIRVFCEERVKPLIVNKRAPKVAVSSVFSTLEKREEESGSKPALSSEDVLNSTETSLINAFGALPRKEQDNILFKLENLKKSLLDIIDTAEPLIDLVSPIIEPLTSPTRGKDLHEYKDMENRSQESQGPLGASGEKEMLTPSYDLPMTPLAPHQEIERGPALVSLAQSCTEHDRVTHYSTPREEASEWQVLLAGAKSSYPEQFHKESTQNLDGAPLLLEEDNFVRDDILSHCSNRTTSLCINQIS